MKTLLSSPLSLARGHDESASSLAWRSTKSHIWLGVFLVAMLVSIVSLFMLLWTVVDGAFGYVALRYRTQINELDLNGKKLMDQSREELVRTLFAQTAVFLEDSDKGISPRRLDALAEEKPLEERELDDLLGIIREEVLQPQILQVWSLRASLFERSSIEAWVPDDEEPFMLEFRSWINRDLLTHSQSPDALSTGVRTAVMGSLWIIVLTLLLAFPIGVGSAIFLEEFVDKRNVIARIIQVNIYNLAGVPSIIYGILGLAVFVRAGEGITGGRTILSAALTLAILVLPIIIINSQEAIRAVPKSLKDSSMGLGATRWQTVWHHVLPGAMDRILTGTILAVSRALGETAPLVVVGAATFLQEDPSSIFSGFTALPIQIYQWTARPQEEFRHVAAAAIIALMILLLVLNGTAMIMRNRINTKRRAMS